MTLAKAIKLLTQKYEWAKTPDWIHNPLAWATHQVWRAVSEDEK